MQVSIVGYESCMPEREVGNDFFDIDPKRLKRGMFAGAHLRRHVDQETCSEMLAQATEKLIDRLSLDAATDVDLILTNIGLGDQFFSGHGLILAKMIGARPKFIYDLENTGCISFVYMAQLAHMLMQQGVVRTALIGCMQAAGGRIYAHPDLRDKPQASIPGDGCGVAYLSAGGESPILSIETRSYPEYSEDMETVYPRWQELVGAGNRSVQREIRPVQNCQGHHARQCPGPRSGANGLPRSGDGPQGPRFFGDQSAEYTVFAQLARGAGTPPRAPSQHV